MTKRRILKVIKIKSDGVIPDNVDHIVSIEGKIAARKEYRAGVPTTYYNWIVTAVLFEEVPE